MSSLASHHSNNTAVNELRAELAKLRHELSESEWREFLMRRDARLDATSAALLGGIRRMIVGYVTVTVVASVGAMFCVAKLFGH
jgi:hypothetical protein